MTRRIPNLIVLFLVACTMTTGLSGAPAHGQTADRDAVSAGPSDGLTCTRLGGGPMIEAMLLFGRRIGETGLVSDAEWNQFVDQEVTPRFPEGLTVQDISGQWRDTVTGRIIHEPSKLILLLVAQTSENLDSLKAIGEYYKRQFRQQAVATVLRPACVSF